jgi:hypothetical protein
VESQRFRSLSARNRALVAMASLLDGREAQTYLGTDLVNGSGLKRAAADLAGADAEMRLLVLGTLLREALEELESVRS